MNDLKSSSRNKDGTFTFRDCDSTEFNKGFIIRRFSSNNLGVFKLVKWTNVYTSQGVPFTIKALPVCLCSTFTKALHLSSLMADGLHAEG